MRIISSTTTVHKRTLCTVQIFYLKCLPQQFLLKPRHKMVYSTDILNLTVYVSIYTCMVVYMYICVYWRVYQGMYVCIFTMYVHTLHVRLYNNTELMNSGHRPWTCPALQTSSPVVGSCPHGQWSAVGSSLCCSSLFPGTWQAATPVASPATRNNLHPSSQGKVRQGQASHAKARTGKSR